MSRPELLATAKLLKDAGIGVHALDEGQGILIRSEDWVRAVALLEHHS